MKRTTLTEQDYLQFYKTIVFGNIDEPIKTSVKTAYRDVCRTISGFSNHPNHNEIYNNAFDLLCCKLVELKHKKFNSKEEFNLWHKDCCDMLISVFDTQKFYYGQAQKWLNMSLKYLSMIDYSLVENHYEYFHVPIDNYIVDITNIKLSTAWSRINSYETYLEFQNLFSDKYPGLPLDEEFRLWLDAKNM